MPEHTTRDKFQLRGGRTEFNTREADNGPIIEGYFAVFNKPYNLWEGASEVIMPGAFDGCLEDDTRALINHNTTLVLGRTTAGTLELRQDDKGLWGKIQLNPNDTDAMNLYARVQRGDVSQCSFGFDIESETFIDLGGGSVRWEINKIGRLYEVSPCTFPAYEDTAIAARMADLETMKQRGAEAWRAAQKTKLEGIIHA